MQVLEGMKCPECGCDIKCKKSFRISIIDLIGASIVSLFLFAALWLIISALSPIRLVIAGVLLLPILILSIYGLSKMLLKRSFMPSGAFVAEWGIGGLLFLIWALMRYFVNAESKEAYCCKSCGFESEGNIDDSSVI